MRIRRGAWAALLALVVPGLVHAGSHAAGPRLREPMAARPISVPLELGASTRLAESAREFVRRRGGTWTFRVDPRTGRLALASGSGIPWPDAEHATTPESFEPAGRRLVAELAPLVAPQRGELRLDAGRSHVRRGGKLVSLSFGWWVDGVPVEDARVFLRANHGRVVQFGSELIAPIEIETHPISNADQARRNLLEHSGDAEGARFRGEPDLLIQAESSGDGSLHYRLVWRLVYRVAQHVETWEGRVDAITGEVVSFRDVNRYGRASGGIYRRTAFDQVEERAPMPSLDVTVEGQPAVADVSGGFAYDGGTATADLRGRWFDIRCDGCSEPAQVGIGTRIGTGNLDFGLGGRDQVGNGRSTPAHRNTFYHLNQARRVALAWLPELPLLQTRHYPVNINIPSSCNAFFDLESVNFFRSGGDCFNTGEISDIIHHEWGHALDFATLPGDGSSGEGTADVLAMHLSHDSRIAPGVFIDGGAFRDLDAGTSARGLVTRSGISQGVCDRDDGTVSLHCVGLLYGQAAWELAGSLAQRHGHHSGWRVSERLFFTSLPDARNWQPESPSSFYDAYLVADDDDGNLANGTPNASLIHGAFATHEIAGDPLIDSPPCAAPTQPGLNTARTCDGIALGWNAVRNAWQYEILRTELTPDSVLFPVAQLPADVTIFIDSAVAPGIEYGYVVLARDAAGCESIVEDPVTARLPAAPALEMKEVEVDETVRGNRSGFPDPGEEVDLRLTLINRGQVAASGVTARVVPLTPGVTMVEAESTWSGLDGSGLDVGESGLNVDPLRFRADPERVACGSSLRFELRPAAAEGCAGAPSYFDVVLGQPDGAGGHTCDDTPACFVPADFAGLQRANPGQSCGEIALSWTAATSNCANATVTYDVHRDASPGVDAHPGNRIATGVRGARFIDGGLTPGTRHYYRVLAVDSRAGSVPNAVERTTVTPGGVDLRAPAWDPALTVDSGGGCGEIALSWPAAREHCSQPVTYEIHRAKVPHYVPNPATLVGLTQSPSFLDAALEPGQDYTYVVRARDASGNATPDSPRVSEVARTFDLERAATPFEISDGGWTVVEPNDAVRGNWDWGDPEGTAFQPENDTTEDGHRCWITGYMASLPGGSNNDVDVGTTTLMSIRYDLAGAVNPIVRYSRWFTNDRGGNPGDERDTFRVHVSNDDGANWILLDEVGVGTPLAWEAAEHALGGVIEPTTFMRFRFTAADPGGAIMDASFVEAAIDDFSIVDPDQGCTGCGEDPPLPVAHIELDATADDVVLRWDPASPPAARYLVYTLSGPRFERAVAVGNSQTDAFVHGGAIAMPGLLAYRVSAVDDCGNESALRD